MGMLEFIGDNVMFIFVIAVLGLAASGIGERRKR
jgi:hypothetical protein